jgi:thiol-disulfide isomerase/thioredoxin
MRRPVSIGLFAFIIGLVIPLARADTPASSGGDFQFDPVGKAILQLLQNRDAGLFATNMAETAGDWQAISSNRTTLAPDQIESNAKRAGMSLPRLEFFAQRFLDRSDALHLDFFKGGWQFRIIDPPPADIIASPRSGTDSALTVPQVKRLEIILEPTASGPSTNGEYKLVVSRLDQFGGAWRIGYPDYVQWIALPSTLADETAQRNLRIMEKAVSNSSVSGQDDPSLQTLAETLVRFLRERDASIYQKEALFTPDMLWALLQKLTPNHLPPRDEFDKTIGGELQNETKLAQSLANQMDAAGIDFKNADIQIKEAKVEHTQSLGAPGSLDGLEGEQFEVTFTVKTEAKTKNGIPLAGDYTLMVNQLSRYGGEWKAAEKIHWAKLPDGVLDSQSVATMDLENYVAANNTLPPNFAAPDLDLTTLSDAKKIKLSDLRGKIVILDFWATWCGPCQQAVADLQTIRASHPAWQDKVAIMPLSIDDTIDVVIKHVNKRGWTNTFNVWAGDGGWNSVAAKQFRLKGVPTTYVIGADGKIVIAGNPANLPIAETVDRLVNAPAKL